VLGLVGDRIPVMVDANQAWTVKNAVAAAHALAPLGVDWLEEPVPAEDVDGSAQVAAAVAMRVAAGESIFSLAGFRDIIERRGADILMPNVVRLGGPGKFMEVASLADAYGLQVSSHTFTEVSAHLMAACINGGLVEYIPGWWDEVFEGAPEIDQGRIRLSDRAGLGFRFAEKVIHDWSCSAGTVEGTSKV